jgi:hypothetical protein
VVREQNLVYYALLIRSGGEARVRTWVGKLYSVSRFSYKLRN